MKPFLGLPGAADASRGSRARRQGVLLEGGGGERRIRTYPDPILRKRCAPVEVGGIAGQSTVDALKATWRPGMLGLAAPQIGLPYRGVALAEKDGYRIFLNPVIVERSPSLVRAPEACLSLPFVLVEIERAAWVVFEAIDPERGDVKLLAHGHQASVAQHEIDHLDGILIIDRLSHKDRRRVLREARSMQKNVIQPPKILVPLPA